MAIVRQTRPSDNFYILDKKISEDDRLSWSARGMLIFLLGKPDHWTVSIEALINCTSSAGIRQSGKTAVYSVIRELLNTGYMTRKKHADGTLDYLVREKSTDVEPDSGNPNLGNPNLENPDLGNPPLVSTDVLVRTEKKVSIDASRGARLSQTWFPSNELVLFCENERPDLDVLKTIEQFRDYWHSKAGAAARKVNWDLTFKNWVRNQRQTNNRKPTWYEENDRVIAELTGRNRKNEPDDGYIDV
jgi:hypothetical protein